MALPVKTTTNDVDAIVRYLGTKPTGATLSDAKAALDGRVLDGRKLAAYKTWGITTKEGEKFKLTKRGWHLARNPDDAAAIYRQIIDGTRAYRSVIEWVFNQRLKTITAIDVASHLHEHHAKAVGEDAKDATLRENAVAFFNLAQAAGFGSMTIGRSGKPTRFDFDLKTVEAHIKEGPSAPPWQETESEDDEEEEPAEGESEEAAEEQAEEEPPEEPVLPDVKSEPMVVFISHGKNKKIVDQIETVLELADFESEVAVKEETTAIPVSDKVLGAMRRCQAGIIAVTVEEGREDADGKHVLNENVLIEIGAAFVLYDTRVVLVWDKRLEVPSNLSGLYRCEFEGDELTGDGVVKLMKAIQDFKAPGSSGG